MNGLEQRSEGLVCASCLEDEGLREFARTHGKIQPCDYCDLTPNNPTVVKLEDVVEFMREVINQEWCDPVQERPYDSAEGGYLGQVLDADDLFYNIGFELSNARLMNDILSPFLV